MEVGSGFVSLSRSGTRSSALWFYYFVSGWVYSGPESGFGGADGTFGTPKRVWDTHVVTRAPVVSTDLPCSVGGITTLFLHPLVLGTPRARVLSVVPGEWHLSL